MRSVVGILVGGQSRRMGRPKALLRVGAETLLERTARVARSVADEVLLLGTPEHEIPASLRGVQFLEDRLAGIGPMAGLEALLLARPGTACILLACDMPNVCEALLRRLAEAEGEFDAAVCRTERAVGTVHRDKKDSCCGLADAMQWHPCCALYRPSALPAVQAAIADRQYGMVRLTTRLRVRPIDLAGDEAAWVSNWNRPEDVGEVAEPSGASGGRRAGQ